MSAKGVHSGAALAAHVVRLREGGGSEPQPHGCPHSGTANAAAGRNEGVQRPQPQARAGALTGGEAAAARQRKSAAQVLECRAVAGHSQVVMGRCLRSSQQLAPPLCRTRRGAV